MYWTQRIRSKSALFRRKFSNLTGRQGGFPAYVIMHEECMRISVISLCSTSHDSHGATHRKRSVLRGQHAFSLQQFILQYCPQHVPEAVIGVLAPPPHPNVFARARGVAPNSGISGKPEPSELDPIVNQLSLHCCRTIVRILLMLPKEIPHMAMNCKGPSVLY